VLSGCLISRMPRCDDILVGQHAPLVRRLALQQIVKLPASVELVDLMQAGVMGLLVAIRRSQPTAYAPLGHCPVHRLSGAMLDELRSQDWLPRSVRSKTKNIEQAVHALGHRLMRPPTEAEIAEEMGVMLPDYQQLLEEARGVQIIHYEDLARHGDDAQRL